MANEDIDQALAQSAASAVQGDFLGAFLAPVKITIARVLAPGRSTTLADVDPARAALESPFRNAAEATGILDAMVSTADARRRAAGLPVDVRPARAAMRRGQLLNAFIIQAPLSLLEGIISASRGGFAIPGNGSESGSEIFDVQDEEESEMEETPIVTGQYAQGMENIVGTEARPAKLRAGITPTLDIGPFIIKPTEIVGAGVGFQEQVITQASGALVILRIPSISNQQIVVQNVNGNCTPQTGSDRARYGLRIGYVAAGAVPVLFSDFRQMHSVTILDNATIAADSTGTRAFNAGQMVIPPGFDYVALAQTISAADLVIFNVNVQAYRLPLGVFGGRVI